MARVHATGVPFLNTCATEAAEAVVNGKAAAAYVSRAQAEAVLFQHKDAQHFQLSPMQLPGLPGNGWPVGMAIKSQHKELGQAIEAALQALRSRGDMLPCSASTASR